MSNPIHIAKDLYIEDKYTFRDLTSTNWGTPLDCPSILTADNVRKANNGDWSSCTSLSTFYSLREFAKGSSVIEQHQGTYDILWPNLTASEAYELVGLMDAIATLNESYSVLKHGNHGTSEGVDIRDPELASKIVDALKTPVKRANELLEKVKE